MQRTNSDSQTMNHEEVDMIDPDDPLLIAQSLTYVTDNGSVLLSYSTAPVTMCTFTKSRRQKGSLALV